jgi:hypothetical protein
MVEQAVKGPIGCFGVLTLEYYSDEFHGGFYREGTTNGSRPPITNDRCVLHGYQADLDTYIGKQIVDIEILPNDLQRHDTSEEYVSVSTKIQFSDESELYITVFNYDGTHPLAYVRNWPGYREMGKLMICQNENSQM